LARDRKQAGIHIPPQEIQYHDIEFDPADYPKQAEVLRNLNHFARVVLDSDRAIGILAMIELILRKRQAVLFPGSIQFKDPITKEILYKVECDESMKLDRLINKDGEGLIPELTADGDLVEGERVVVFSQFKTALKELETRLAKYAPDISVCRYDGDTNERVQEEIKLDFDRKYTDPQKAKYQVMLANYKKGGQGLNFTGATQMILMDEEWNPGKEEQAMGRLDRMGQTEETTVHVLRMQNSIDTWMAELIEQKRDMIAGFDKGMQMQQELLRGIDEGML
jgi:SNF2 family DNA or RNA helicase